MVDRDGLENRCARKRTVGSNPTPSASFKLLFLQCYFYFNMDSNLSRSSRDLGRFNPPAVVN